MKTRVLVSFLFGLNACLIIFILLSQSELIILNPAGIIASKEKQLLITIAGLGLSIILPTVILTYLVAFRFRSTSNKAYSPQWQSSLLLQLILWFIPTILILITAAITWKSTHELDPRKAIPSKTKALTIQVVALRWKWLFIYPEQQIATVNYVAFPAKTPITFQLTADAPMNSFWIPHLAGQMYAMEGMVNTMRLMADRTGTFPGSAAEISGAGFTTMRFSADAKSASNFTAWIKEVKATNKTLTDESYRSLAKPSKNVTPTLYSAVSSDLYTRIVRKTMPTSVKNSEQKTSMNNVE